MVSTTHLSTNTNRIINFRVVSPTTDRIVGYERLAHGHWQYSVDNKLWEPGIFEGDDLIRDEGSGVYDKSGRQMYERDVVQYAGHVNRVIYTPGMFGYTSTSSHFNPADKHVFALYSKLEVVGRQ